MDVSGWARKKSLDPVESRALGRLARLKPKEGKPGRVLSPIARGDDEPYNRVADHETIHKLIASAPVRRVRLDGLVTNGQESVRVDQVAHYISNPTAKGHRHGKASTDHPIVVRVGGKDVLYDGNHRVTAAMLRGEKAVDARYADLDGWLRKHEKRA